jgi:hypothetical protein
MPFDHGARDKHTHAIELATGISATRLVELSRTLDGRAYHVEPYMSQAYEDGVDTYELELCRASTERQAARAVFSMIESEDIDQLMLKYFRLTAGAFSGRDAFLSILADITEDN